MYKYAFYDAVTEDGAVRDYVDVADDDNEVEITSRCVKALQASYHKYDLVDFRVVETDDPDTYLKTTEW